MSIDLYNLLTGEIKLKPQVFSDQVIVITGAGRGIGFQTARAFAQLGGQVILAELSEEGLVAEVTIRKEGGSAHFIKTDVSDPESVSALFTCVRQTFGAIDILINNAIYIQQASVLDMPVEMWERTMSVNLRGTYLTCRGVLPEMLAKDKGLIINLVSTDAMPGLSAYIASKAGITAFSQSLALELEGTGVRVIPFGPGMVDTPGIRSVASGLAPQLGLTERQFLNLSLHADYDGLMPPEHAGAATAYLAAHLADEFHGQSVTGYEVLTRAGLLSQSTDPLHNLSSSESTPEGNTQALLNKLSAILGETEAEFGQLPVFVRPMAKAGFKNKSGMRLQDWQHLVADLVIGNAPIPPNMVERLNALSKYYREAPLETARFTKDEATLQIVAETARSRLDVIEVLISRIE